MTRPGDSLRAFLCLVDEAMTPEERAAFVPQPEEPRGLAEHPRLRGRRIVAWVREREARRAAK